jgi:hypothetical protein
MKTVLPHVQRIGERDQLLTGSAFRVDSALCAVRQAHLLIGSPQHVGNDGDNCKTDQDQTFILTNQCQNCHQKHAKDAGRLDKNESD